MRGIWEQFGRHLPPFEVLFNTLFFGYIATHARGLGRSLRFMHAQTTLRQNVYECARLRISGFFFSHFLPSSQIKVSRALSASFCVRRVVQLFCFMLLVF